MARGFTSKKAWRFRLEDIPMVKVPVVIQTMLYSSSLASKSRDKGRAVAARSILHQRHTRK